MAGNSNDKVVCCFCGNSLFFKEATILIVQPNPANEERQQLFCHKNCFVERVDKLIFLHPDFFEDTDASL